MCVRVTVFGNPATYIHVYRCILLRWHENGPYYTKPGQMLSLCKGSDWMTSGQLTWKIFKLLLSIIFKCTECQDKNPPSINSRTVIIPTAQRKKKKVEQSKLFLSVPPIVGIRVQTHTFTHAKRKKHWIPSSFSMKVSNYTIHLTARKRLNLLLSQFSSGFH